MNRDHVLLRRIKTLTWLFIIGLIVSGATAIPLQTEVDWLVKFTGASTATAESSRGPILATWLINVQSALSDTNANHPILFYGTDWLAFGHFVIAITFIGALRDPVRNRWLYDFGLITCVLVVPYALIFGAVRGIPFWWRLIDCSFGVCGFVPLWLCRKWVSQLTAAGETS